LSSPTEFDALDRIEDNERNIRSTWLISMFTLISRVLGYARFILMIHLFASMRWVTDAIIFAFRIPNLFRNLLGEGALSAAFIPVFVRTNKGEGKESTSRLASQIFTLLALVGGIISILGIVICYVLLSLANGSRELEIGLKLTAIFMIFMPLTCCAALLSGMLQGLRRFSLPASLSIILNIGFLAGFAYVYWWQAGGNLANITAESSYAIVIFVLFAGMVEVLIQLPVLYSQKILVFPTFKFDHPGLKMVLKGFIPTALGLGLVQINAFIDSLIAGTLALDSHGAITYLDIGIRFMQLPLGVFGVAIATASFPDFAHAAANNNVNRLFSNFTRSVRMSIVFLLPSAAVLIAMADPIIRLTCQRPDLLFDHAAVYRSSIVLIIYSAGLLFYSMRQIMVRIFYAQGDYSYPVKVSVYMVILNVILNLTLIHFPDLYRANFHSYFRHWNIPADAFPNGIALGEAGLALATLITAIVDSTILWLGAKKRFRPALESAQGKADMKEALYTLARIGVTAVAVGILTWLFRNSIPYEPGFWPLLTRTLVPCILAGVSFYIIAIILPLPEMREILYPLLNRRKQTK